MTVKHRNGVKVNNNIYIYITVYDLDWISNLKSL